MKKINNKKKRTLRNRKKLKSVSINKYRVFYYGDNETDEPDERKYTFKICIANA